MRERETSLVLQPAWRVDQRPVTPRALYMDPHSARQKQDLGDLKRRVTGIEDAIAGQNRRIDRIELWLDRIEQRLMLMDLRG
jgi:hypothetical protein